MLNDDTVRDALKALIKSLPADRRKRAMISLLTYCKTIRGIPLSYLALDLSYELFPAKKVKKSPKKRRYA